MAKTIEQKVADAILQKNDVSIEISGVTYRVAPPSIATLIRISEIVSTLPVVERLADPTQIVTSVLHHAKDFRPLARIAAILILGAKDIEAEQEQRAEKRMLLGLFKRKRKVRIKTTQQEMLAQEILYNVRPSVLWDLIVKRLNMLEIGDFFAITTSLSEANILKPTKEVEN